MRNLLQWMVCLTLSLTFSGFAHANSIDDMLTVKQVSGQQATLEGKTNGLKAGDKIYFARSPFQFSVTAVTGNQVTIALPSGNDVAVGQTMVREPTASMKKAIDTEERLKKALED
jgi:hypothetical protein